MKNMKNPLPKCAHFCLLAYFRPEKHFLKIFCFHRPVGNGRKLASNFFVFFAFFQFLSAKTTSLPCSNWIKNIKFGFKTGRIKQKQAPFLKRAQEYYLICRRKFGILDIESAFRQESQRVF
jgi:hypothetical protein